MSPNFRPPVLVIMPGKSLVFSRKSFPVLILPVLRPDTSAPVMVKKAVSHVIPLVCAQRGRRKRAPRRPAPARQQMSTKSDKKPRNATLILVLSETPKEQLRQVPTNPDNSRQVSVEVHQKSDNSAAAPFGVAPKHLLIYSEECLIRLRC